MVNKIISRFKDKINVLDKNIKDVLSTSRTLKETDKFLAILKKWNSASPKYPLNRHKDFANYLKYDYTAGGGFFLVLDGYGLIIDPGYNFLEIFYENGFVPRDINGILISHSHDDHSIDLESIFSVLFKVNKYYNLEKKVDLFINPVTYDKYSMMFEADRKDIINNINIITGNSKLEFKNDNSGKQIKFAFFKTCHLETPWCNDKFHGIGVIIEYDGRRIFYSGDSEYRDVLKITEQEFCEILLLNLGKLGELDPKATDNHLGLSGIIEIIKHMTSVVKNQSKLTIIISEMGFEFIKERLEFIKAIREYTKEDLNSDITIKVMYTEPGTIISIDDSSVITRLSFKLNELKKYDRIKDEIREEINGFINCNPIEHDFFNLKAGNYLDFGIKPEDTKRINMHNVFLPRYQTFFDRNDVGFRLEKIIYTLEDRINDVDAIKYGLADKHALISKLREIYKLRKGEYITLFEYESIERI